MLAHIICMYCGFEYRTDIWPGEGECTSHGMCMVYTLIEKKKMRNRIRAKKRWKEIFVKCQ